jgi:starch synthase (maltosyl-transferring)
LSQVFYTLANRVYLQVMAKRAPSRIVMQYPSPAIDGGRYAVKRCAGEQIDVCVDVFRDGHDLLAAAVRLRLARAGAGERPAGREQALEALDAAAAGVRWGTTLELGEAGDWEYELLAWVDRFGTWRDELARKLAAGQRDLTGELSEGRVLIERIRTRAHGEPEARAVLDAALARMDTDPWAALDAELYAVAARHQQRDELTTLGPLPVRVDRQRGCFGAWYELFPRSWGGFAGVRAQLPRLAELGFDVLYMPPIHPIGHTNRKGANNALVAGPADPGSPYAIGDESGGHDAIHPELGSEQELRELTAAAAALGIDVALDLALNCSPDHPWLVAHPEWFQRRPDGTLKYAENPPKRYQDIYNFNWDSEDWRGLWQALLDVVLHWVGAGVKVFRVDNPHTKPVPFWEWLIAQVHACDDDVIFLAEAFTRRAMMRHLAKVGFTQSYTYFTWKNSRHELIEYVSELAHGEEREYLRPNFFANTPDILHAYLQQGGPPAFAARLVLAATLSPSYGIYSGFENFENTPLEEGSEEYLGSEKYERKTRTLDGPLLDLIQRVNLARRAHPALAQLSGLTFLQTANEALIAYAKRAGSDTVITVVNLDPHGSQEGLVTVGEELYLPDVFSVKDLLSGAGYRWRRGGNYVRLGPGEAHVAWVEVG